VQLFGLIQDKGVTTLATPRSQTTSAGSVYHARLERDSIIETRDSRYKAGLGSWKRFPKPFVVRSIRIGGTNFSIT